jgi:hypothetical protein
MSDISEERLEEIFDLILSLLDEHNISPEDGALISSNLLFRSLNLLTEDEESLITMTNIMSELFAGISGHNDFSETLNAISEISKVSVIFRGDDKYFSFGPNKTWGLDPTLLKEEH